ncbi:hypothetical protein ACEPAG_4905 [Sanghuangporus baumii]
MSAAEPVALSDTQGIPNAERLFRGRNMSACSRCADQRLKCNMDPPYSSSKCERCCRDKVEICPPHRPRRSRRKRAPTMSDLIESNIPAEANAIPSAPDAIAAMNNVATGPGYAELLGVQGSSQSNNSIEMYSNDTAQPDINTGVASKNPRPYSNQEDIPPLVMPFEGLHGLLSASYDFPWYRTFANGNMWEGFSVSEDNDWQIPV